MYHKTMISPLLLVVLLISTNGCMNENSGVAKIAKGDASHGSTATGKTIKETVKSGAALEFSYRMQKPVTANVAHSVTILVDHDYVGQSLTLTASADAAVRLSSASATARLSKDRQVSWTIPFTATADGLYYINVFGTVTDANGATQSRAYAVRVEVGDQSGQKKPPPAEIILPANEKIS